MAFIKATFNVDEDILERFRVYADENGMTQSALLNMALKKYLDAEEMKPAVTELLKQFVGISINKAGLSQEDQLEAMEEVEEKLQKLTG